MDGVDAGLLDLPCESGELETATGCQAAGIPEARCPPGFVADGRSGCEPTLPVEPCAPGTMAVPGEATCRPVAPCGDGGPWDGIPVDATTEHVDPNFVGMSDGSAVAPWTTIAEALSAAEAGAVVALAPGTYVGNVVVSDAPVKIWGKCPTEVTLETNNQAAAVFVQADGTELHRVGITGNGTALWVQDATVVAEQIWIHDVSWIGTYLDTPLGETTALALRDSLVENVANQAAYVSGASLSLDGSVVRDVVPYDGQNGYGVQAGVDPGSGTRPSVIVTGSLVERVHRGAVRVYGGDAVLTATALRDVSPTEDAQTLGAGVLATRSMSEGVSVTLDGVSVARTHWGGVVVLGGDLVAERLTVRDVATPAGESGSLGVAALSVDDVPRASAMLREVSVADVDFLGVAVSGADASLAGIAVEDMRPFGLEALAGAGLLIEPDLDLQRSDAWFEGVRVTRCRSAGVAIVSSDVAGRSLLVTDVAPHADLGVAGRGLTVEVTPAGAASVLELTGAAIHDVHEAGVAILGSEATLTSLAVSDVAFPPAASVLGEAVISYGVLVQRSFETGAVASASLDRVVVQRAGFAGIAVTGADATVAHGIVLDNGLSGAFGDGIDVIGFIEDLDDPTSDVIGSVQVSETLVGFAQRAGIGMFAARATLFDVLLSCNDIHLNGEAYESITYDLVNEGQVRCVCDDVPEDCKVLSANLTPPPAL